ncbi:MAG TPA: PPOX class F420-dependent oxidoreductase [Acidimicrobiales bacterium]|nr:PPOX class F420-dependent oxidoreductase [Acidimicrobiales bacterium]
MPFDSMTSQEVMAFLNSAPARTGIVATTREDGSPHAAPVWYVVDEDGSVLFNTGARSVKGRNLRREGRAALCVDDETPPYAFVTIEGPVAITEELDEVRRWATTIGARYMGADRADEFGARNGVPGELLVRLIPERVIAVRDLAD